MTRAFSVVIWLKPYLLLPSHPPESLLLRFGHQPRIFDFRGWSFAAEHVCDFARGVGLALDVGFVGVRCRVASDDDVGKREDFMVGGQRFRVSDIEGGAGDFAGD